MNDRNNKESSFPTIAVYGHDEPRIKRVVYYDNANDRTITIDTMSGKIEVHTQADHKYLFAGHNSGEVQNIQLSSSKNMIGLSIET